MPLDSCGKFSRVSHTTFFLITARFYLAGAKFPVYFTTFPCFSHLTGARIFNLGCSFACTSHIAPFQHFTYFTQQRRYTTNPLVALHTTTKSPGFLCFSDPLLPHIIHTTQFRVHPSVTSIEVKIHLYIPMAALRLSSHPPTGSCQSIDQSSL